MKFNESARGWLTQVAERNQEFYRAAWDVSHCGRQFPLRQKMEIETNHPILSIKTKRGKVGIAAEYCYFDICETLDRTAIQQYFQLFEELEKTDVDSANPAHDYTFLSLVIVTNDFSDRSLQKEIRRFRCVQRYRKEDQQYGWSAAQICIVDLANRKLYWNASGDSLKNRLTDESFQPSTFFERIRGLSM